MSKIVFSYRGLDRQGGEVKGTVEAVNKADALNRLHKLEDDGVSEIAIEAVNVADRAAVNGNHAPPQPRKALPAPALVVVAGLLVVLAAGLRRVYYGGGVGLQIVYKHSFSFKDTIVNLDDLLGQPRILVASKHPAVKKQLEEMGVIETDEQLMSGIRQEAEAESRRLMESYNEATEKYMKSYNEAMKDVERKLGY